MTTKANPINRVMNLKPCEWAWCITLLFLFLRYFTAISSLLLYCVYTLGLCCLLFLEKAHRDNSKSSKQINVLPLVFVTVLLLVLLCSPYSKEQLLKFSIMLFDAYLLLVVFKVKEVLAATRLFYLLGCGVILLFYICYVFFPIFPLFSSTGGMVLPGVPDSNETGIVIFLFFCIAIKKRWKLGIIVGILYLGIYFGRQYILMLAITISAIAIMTFVRYVQNKNPQNRIFSRHSFNKDNSKEEIGPSWFFLIFILSTVVVIVFSYYWVNNVASNDIDEYKTSLNDSSNAIRMNSNVFVVEHMLSNPDFLVYGYDSDVFDVLGIISSEDGEVTDGYLIDGQFRLVQPHNEVLNTLLKEGVLFVLIYYALVSFLLSKITYTKTNKAILIAYFVGSLIFAALFRDFRLIGLLIVLLIEDKNKNQSLYVEQVPNAIKNQ